eukprot:3233895-Amphidinium_carterae.1
MTHSARPVRPDASNFNTTGRRVDFVPFTIEPVYVATVIDFESEGWGGHERDGEHWISISLEFVEHSLSLEFPEQPIEHWEQDTFGPFLFIRTNWLSRTKGYRQRSPKRHSLTTDPSCTFGTTGLMGEVIK